MRKGLTLKKAHVSEVNGYLIDRINEHYSKISGGESLITRPDGRGFILSLDEAQQQGFLNSTFIKNIYFPNLKFTVFKIDDKAYIACQSRVSLNFKLEGLKEVKKELEQDDPADTEIEDNLLYLVGTYFAGLKVRDNVVAEELCSVFGTGRVGPHDLNEIRSLFRPITFLRIEDPGVVTKDEDINQLIGNLIYKNDHLWERRFSPETIAEFRRYYENYPYNQNIISALLSKSNKYAFLDVYHLVEQFFWYNQMDKLASHLKLEIEYDELKEALASELRYSPQEKVNIEELFRLQPIDEETAEGETDAQRGNKKRQLVNPDTLQEIADLRLAENATLPLNPKDTMTNGANVGSLIYVIRNMVVHFQKAGDDVENLFMPEVWDGLIRCTLKSAMDLEDNMPRSYIDLATGQRVVYDAGTY